MGYTGTHSRGFAQSGAAHVCDRDRVTLALVTETLVFVGEVMRLAQQRLPAHRDVTFHLFHFF